MILSSPVWTPQLTSAELLRAVLHQQKRFKTFVRRVDKNNEVYFTVAKRGPSQNPNPTALQHEFFEMPDLLLDLDAEGTRDVRPSTEADEEKMTAKWDANPRRVAVRAHIQELKEQVWESRRRMDGIMSNPTNVWRLTSHDVLSAALKGGSSAVRETQRIGRRPLTTEITNGMKSRPTTGLIETLRRENGIPLHAVQDDQLLLEWLLLRVKSLRHHKRTQGEDPISSAQLIKALKEQSSITGIRRLVFQALTSGAKNETYLEDMGFGKDPTSSSDVQLEIREACLRVLAQTGDSSDTHDELLGFIGNLADRVSRREGHLGGALSGLALRITAQEGFTQATSEWLHRGHASGALRYDTKAPEDVLETLQILIKRLETTGDQSAHDRQLIFQVLTGIEENHSLSADSFRALTKFYIGERSTVPFHQAFSIYESYLTLLGQLGALHTIWKERNVTVPMVMKQLESHSMQRDVAGLFHNALAMAITVAAPPNNNLESDLSVNECITLDYHSIALQNLESWICGERTEASNKPDGSGDGLPPLNLPLNQWIPEVGKLIQRKLTNET